MRRVLVEISIRGGIARADFRSGERFGALEVEKTEGDAWTIAKLTLARPGEVIGDPIGAADVRACETVLALARAEADKRGLIVDGVSVSLESSR